MKNKYLNKIISLITILSFTLLGTLGSYENVLAATKSLATTYSEKKWFVSIGNGHEVADVYARYSEDYTPGTTTNTFNHRAIMYTVTLTNNSPDIETDVYMFPTSSHYTSGGTLLNRYTLSTSESAIFPGGVDYCGFFSNSSSIAYPKSTSNYAQVGFMINVNGAIPWSDSFKLSLSTNSSLANNTLLSTNSENDEKGNNISYELGQIEAEKLRTVHPLKEVILNNLL